MTIQSNHLSETASLKAGNMIYDIMKMVSEQVVTVRVHVAPHLNVPDSSILTIEPSAQNGEWLGIKLMRTAFFLFFINLTTFTIKTGEV